MGYVCSGGLGSLAVLPRRGGFRSVTLPLCLSTGLPFLRIYILVYKVIWRKLGAFVSFMLGQ
jgi:hypothetical protein